MTKYPAMPDAKKLSYLLKLLDDDSPAVREVVLKELMAYGPDLERELLRLDTPPDDHQKSLIVDLLRERHRILLKQSWQSWFGLENDYEKLEAALSLLSDYQSGAAEAGRLKILLDETAAEFASLHARGNPYMLAQFLANRKQLKGADQNDYMNPENSNLFYVFDQKKGIPISLACVFMLLGKRLGIPVEGCNFPGHFLARVRIADRVILVDCYNGWKFIDEKDIEYTDATQDLELVIKTETPAETIIARVLTNLVRAYEAAGDEDNSRLMQELLGISGIAYSE